MSYGKNNVSKYGKCKYRGYAFILTFFLPEFHKWNKISRGLQTILLGKFKLGFGFTVLFRSCSFLQDIIITNYLLSE